MANLHLKLNGTWKVPKKVWVKQSGTWVAASKVWRNNSGTWIKHWPPPIDFIQDTATYNFSGNTVTADDGWSAWGTLLIPSSYRNSTIAHITSLTMTMSSSYGDDDRHDDGSGVDGNNTLQLEGQLTTVANYGGFYMGALNYTGYYSAGDQNNAGVRTGTINVPANHLLVGIEYQIFSYKHNRAGSGFNFRLITAPVIGGTVSKSGAGVFQQVYKDTGSHISGTRTGTLYVPIGSSIYAVGMGYGFTIVRETEGDAIYDDADSGSHADMVIQTYHQPTTTLL